MITDDSDPKIVATFILTQLAKQKHFTLGTVDAQGNPWIVCLNLAFDNDVNIIWKSNANTEHSKHILTHPEVAICVFSHDEEMGDFGLYIKAIADEVTDMDELTKCLQHRYTKVGKPAPDIKDFAAPALDRIYLARITHAWVNDSRHIKIPVDLETMRAIIAKG
jgi:uncharacterized pyridoxamine 5'-phosphate oxidase family protein